MFLNIWYVVYEASQTQGSNDLQITAYSFLFYLIFFKTNL